MGLLVEGRLPEIFGILVFTIGLFLSTANYWLITDTTVVMFNYPRPISHDTCNSVLVVECSRFFNQC